MKPSINCFNLIREFESCKLTAYPDPGSKDGIPITIGWGSTARKDGTPFHLKDTITQQEADQLLSIEVFNLAAGVSRLVEDVEITQDMFDALVDFAYNLGLHALAGSTLLKKIIANPLNPTITLQFLRWNKNDGKVMKGLTRRRTAEANLYFNPKPSTE